MADSGPLPPRGQWRRPLPFKPAADEAPVRGGLAQFVPKQQGNATYNSLCPHDGCPCMEHGRYSDTIENMVNQEGAANGKLRQFYVMPYGVRNVSGVTADILRKLYERLYS
jgi:hypothetical protein